MNIGSGSNKAPFPGLIAYTASRGGIEMLTKVSAVELGPLKIRVNCIAPGAIEVERTPEGIARLRRHVGTGDPASPRRPAVRRRPGGGVRGE